MQNRHLDPPMISDPRCPFGKEECSLADELSQLRQEVLQLRESIRVDALTGYYNFRYFKEALTHELERTRRTALPTGLIIADLDYFKSINDTYGHETGNAALSSTATLWRGQIRQLDIPCRYGGEEFAIIMPSTRIAMALRVAERLRRILAETPLWVDGQKISLSASFGVDCLDAEEEISSDRFVERTDKYLLEAKNSGRNQVCYDEEKMDNYGTQVSADERKLLFDQHAGEPANKVRKRGRKPKIISKGPMQHGE